MFDSCMNEDKQMKALNSIKSKTGICIAFEI